MRAFPPPNTTTCPDCGERLGAGAATAVAHECDIEQRLDVVVAQMHAEADSFDDQWAAWLESPAGRFAVWLAARTR